MYVVVLNTVTMYCITIQSYSISVVCVYKPIPIYSNADTMGVLLAHVFVANQCACMFEFTHMYTYTHAHNCNSYVYTLAWEGYKYAGYMYIDIRRYLNVHRLSVMFNWPIKVAHWSPSLHIQSIMLHNPTPNARALQPVNSQRSSALYTQKASVR